MTGTTEPLDPLAPLTAVDSWDRLVSAALVGTSRRAVPDTPDLPSTPAAEGAETLLDRAALAAVRRAAGYTPAEATPVAPDAPDERPEVGQAATRRLEGILAGRLPLLPEWLELAAAGGRRAAHSSVPALLDQGARDSRLRPALAAAVGGRGHWLARFNPGWEYMLGESLPGDRFDRHEWEQGSPARRRRALAALRTTDPDAARELLRGVWSDLAKAELRRRLLEALATGLGPADEEFLEHALDDRGANVRGLALSLLTRLPDSAHAHRLRGHVREYASAGDNGGLRVETVHTRRDDIHRDLALAAPQQQPEGKNERSERLWALVTHAPLDVWPDLLGTGPSGILDAATDSGDAELRDAFVNAVVVQEDTAWARAVLEAIGPRVSHRSHAHTRGAFQLEKLLDLLPVEERCAHVQGVLNPGVGLERWGEMLRATRGPWTAALSEQVVRRLHRPGRGRDSYGYREVCEAAAEHMPPEHLAGLSTEPPFDDTADAYLRLRDTLRFRLDMHKEL
ncbi:DUF5691 domain-containing protein [Nocardiopsis sp. NPDC006198]|uniref:DUF5691 domain-containing protein n=1 Tax=Nocardiopsis sp. NPDC006198 TaxID=3154472 RepID=UPI0033B4E795